MRTFGMILSILAVASLIIGATTAMMLYSSAVRMYHKFQEVRATVENDIEEVKGFIDGVEKVFEESQGIVEDYEGGQITDIHDERVKSIFSQISDTLKSTKAIRKEAEDDLVLVESNIDDLVKEGLGLVPLSIISLVTLIISGWLFGFGISFRAAGRQ